MITTNRLLKIHVILYIFLYSIVSLHNVSYAEEFDVQGEAVAIDGDTIIIWHDNNKHIVRLYGVDAAEIPSKLGIKARIFLDDMLDESPHIGCHVKDVDRYKRLVGMCFNDKEVSINLTLIKEGLALSYRRYLNDDDIKLFMQIEKDARNRNKGLWTNY